MCGIIGYVGNRPVVPLVLEGLRRLEYRGYDSSGIAVIEPTSQGPQLQIVRAQGKLSALEERLQPLHFTGIVGMGHTRWATHGRPSDENAHPHKYGSVAVIHNGIIENYLDLRSMLQQNGHVFQSETDTEIIAHLIEAELRVQNTPNLLQATTQALQKVHGAYAIVVVSDKTPQELVCAKNASPLIVGLGQNEFFVASDLPAILPHTRQVVFLEEGDVAHITHHGMRLYDLQERPIERETKEITWSAATAEKEGFKHFMLKEIHEQVRAITDTLRGRLQHSPADVLLDGFEFPHGLPKRIILLACGTSFHAASIGASWLEQLAKIPAQAELASEFRYRDAVLGPSDFVIALSQSGETADTLAAIREAKRKGAYVFSIVNVVGSSIPRASDFTFYTHAGLEIGVASTKAFTTQLTALFLVALYTAKQNKAISDEEMTNWVNEVTLLPHRVGDTLAAMDKLPQHAKQHIHRNHMIFLGRGLQYPIALEGALKLKEISYIHAEGYPAGEIKHGPMALIDENMPVVVITVQDKNYEKVLSNLSEVKARGAFVLAIATEGDSQIENLADGVLYVPKINSFLYPLLSVIPLQLLAYHVADLKGNDVDQPRNLAKSVTVE